MSSTNPMELFSPFLPATYNIPEEADRLNAFLNDKFSMISDVVNDKTIGNYIQNFENFNGEKWAYDVVKTRNGYRSVARIPFYPNAGVLTLELTSDPAYPIMNVNPQFVISQTYGTASKPCTETGQGDGDYFTFMNQGDSRVSYTMSDTTIVITTTVDLTAYSGFIVINYIRDGV